MYSSYFFGINVSFPSTDKALYVSPWTFVRQVDFGGLYIAGNWVPKWVTWIRNTSIIKQNFEGLFVNELRRPTFDDGVES